MTIERLREILEAYGAEPRRWPEAERDAALALIGRLPEARALRDGARRLDALLDEAAPLMDLELDAAGIVARVKTAKVTPMAGKVRRPPPRAGNGRLSFGWPSFAGLAAAAAAGFIVGWMGLGADYGLNGGTEVSDQPPGLAFTEVEPW